MPSPTRAQVDQVRAALDAARSGSGSLSQLATAHDLAAGSGLPSCAAELRSHMRRRLTPDSGIARDVVLGLATGVLTHHLLGQ